MKDSTKSASVSNKHNNTYDSDSSSSSDSDESRTRPEPPNPKRAASTSPKKKVYGNLLDKFVADNPNFTKLDVNDVISKNEDVYVLEMPKSIDPTLLLDKTIKFHKRSKVKLQGTKYIVEPSNEDIKPINLLGEQLQVIHPVALLKLREYKKESHESEAVEFEASLPALPDNLKVRHPLFGSDYKHKVELDEEIQRKLDGAIDKAVKKLKKKKHREAETSQEPSQIEEANDSKRKKKKHKRTAEEDAERSQNVDMDESIFALLEDHVSARKKERRNYSEEEQTEVEVGGSQSSFSEKKKKKRRNSIKEEIVQDFEMNGGMEHFDSFAETDSEHKKKGKRRSKGDNEGRENYSFEECNKESEHKKKGKSRSKGENEGRENYSFEDCDKDSEHKKKGKSRSKGDNEVRENYSFEEKHDKSKKHQSNIKQEQIFSFNMIEDFEEQNESTREKGKHKKRIKEEVVKVEENVKKLEKKNRRNSIANSTVIPGLQLPLFEFDVSGITNKEEMESSQNDESFEGDKEHKKKKKKQNSAIEETEMAKPDESNLDDSIKKRKRKHEGYQDDVSPKKRIKKEKVDEETSSLIWDILNKVKSEIDTSTHKKKKKSDR